MTKHLVLFQNISKRLFAARLLVGWVVEACEHDAESELVQVAGEIVRLRVSLQLQGVNEVQVDHLRTKVGLKFIVYCHKVARPNNWKNGPGGKF